MTCTPRQIVDTLLIAVLAALPLVAWLSGQHFVVTVLTRTVILALAAVSLNLILGYGGMISFGHAVYLGVGGYAVGILAQHGLSNGFLHFGLAMAGSAVLALGIGALSLRTRGGYFIMITAVLTACSASGALAMAEALLRIVALQKRFGGVVATDNVSLEIRRGEVHALIGPNGAGKTTLMAQLTGQLRPDAGTIHFAGRDITPLSMPARAQLGLARSFQITSVLQDFTALDNVALAVQAHQGHSFRFWKPARRDASLRDPALAALRAVGLSTRAEVLAARLSHGEQRQLEIAMALASDAIMLLDEPTAGMGPDESARLVAYLKTLKGKRTILLVEHDMDAVFALADRITVLVYGRAIATDSPAAIRANAAVRQAYLGDEAAHA